MRRSAPVVSVILLALACATTATAQAPRLDSTAPAETPPSLVDDIELGARLVGRGLTAPLRWSGRQWLVLPAAAAVLGAVSVADEPVEALAETHQGTVGDAYFGALEPFGEEYSLVVAVGLYAGGWALRRPRLRRVAVEGAAASVVAAGVVTPTLKLAFGRSRPRKELGAYRFRPFSGEFSFPSGHTTQAFAVASVIAAESERLAVHVVAYGVAASVGAARIYHDAHFLTDVLAGAAIGTVVGHAMVRGGRELTGSAYPVVSAVGGRTAVGLRIPLR